MDQRVDLSRLRSIAGFLLVHHMDPSPVLRAVVEIERLRAGGCARDQGTTQFCAEAAAMSKEIERLRAENADLKHNVIAFCGVWAENYARNHRLPRGHLHADHYDILQKAGARMVDFVRHDPALSPTEARDE